MVNQLSLDFSKTPSVDVGKKTERIPCAVSSDLKDFLDLFCSQTGITRSELIAKYITEGLQRDIAQRFLAQPHLNKSLSQIIKEGWS